ncbi:hypothetical protein [Chitinophaga sp. RAB17]|uniref:hypothetical protein n=1 Tax=Chitinophaga sp. RAB17 TaxID=3233049 RepID=UPI003F90B197
MSIKKAYYYLFYKLYKYYQRGPSVWLTDWKAALSLDVLVLFIPLSVLVYYLTFFGRNLTMNIENLRLIIPGAGLLLIVLPNYFIFNSRDQWRNIVNEFDQLPEKENRLGGWIVFGAVLSVIGNLVFSYYLLYNT